LQPVKLKPTNSTIHKPNFVKLLKVFMCPPIILLFTVGNNILNKDFRGLHFKKVFEKYNRLTAMKTSFIKNFGITDSRQRGK
jgi:hypothetical protein